MTRPQTAFFFIHHQGHGGGGWLLLCVNNHPAGKMSMLGEIHQPNQLNFAGRNIPVDNFDREMIKFFEDRIYYGDTTIGICKSFHHTNVKWARQRMGNQAVRIIQMVRNPIHRFAEKWRRKKGPANQWFWHLYGRSPKNEQEECEAASAYFAQNYFEKFLNRTEYPIIRLEDLNRSMNKDGAYFRRFMEWLTQTEWSQDYIQHIHDNWTPAYQYHIHLGWDGAGRCCKIDIAQREKPTWNRDWNDDPEPARYWHNLTDWQLDAYLKYNTKCQKRLGYNQSGQGTVETDWEFRGKYPWGEV